MAQRKLGALPSQPNPEDRVFDPDSNDDDAAPTTGQSPGGRMLYVQPNRAYFPQKHNIIEYSTLQEYVFNQKNIGSCACNAVAAAYMYEVQMHGVEGYYAKGSNSFVPSRLWLYYFGCLDIVPGQQDNPNGSVPDSWFQQIRQNRPTDILFNDKGTRLRKLIRIVQGLGVPDEQDYRYDGGFGQVSYRENAQSMPLRLPKNPSNKWDDNTFALDPNVQNTIVQSSAAAIPPPENAYRAIYKLLDVNFDKVNSSLAAWKKTLINGHAIMFSCLIYWTSFNQNQADPWIAGTPPPNSTETLAGRHAMLCVGYNDNVTKSDGTGNFGGHFRVQNSWGKEYPGNSFWIPYSWLTTLGPNQQSSADRMIYEAFSFERTAY